MPDMGKDEEECTTALGHVDRMSESLGLSALQQGRFSQEHTHFLLAELEDVGVCDGEPLDDDDGDVGTVEGGTLLELEALMTPGLRDREVDMVGEGEGLADGAAKGDVLAGGDTLLMVKVSNTAPVSVRPLTVRTFPSMSTICEEYRMSPARC